MKAWPVFLDVLPNITSKCHRKDAAYGWGRVVGRYSWVELVLRKTEKFSKSARFSPKGQPYLLRDVLARVGITQPGEKGRYLSNVN